MSVTYLDEGGLPAKRCPRCKTVLRPDCFHKHRATPDGLFRWCKECAKANARAFYRLNPDKQKRSARKRKSSSPEIFIRRIWQSGALSRRHKSEIDHQYLIEKYHEQGGKCYWTGIQMTHQCPAGVPNTNASPDRIDPNIGYIPGNVVMCCCCINQMRRAMTAEQFISMCQKVVGVHGNAS